MGRKADFSDEHWAAIVRAGPAIARAVSRSGGSNGQSESELDAFLGYVSDGTVEHERQSLLGDLVWDVNAWLATSSEPVGEDAYMEGLEAARRAGAILSVAADPADAIAIRAWLLEPARRVAAAARDGGVLGIGGADVTAWERDTIAAVADALGGGPAS